MARRTLKPHPRGNKSKSNSVKLVYLTYEELILLTCKQRTLGRVLILFTHSSVFVVTTFMVIKVFIMNFRNGTHTQCTFLLSLLG